MKLTHRVALVPFVALLAACGGGGQEQSAGMDGMIDGVPVDQSTTTTAPTEATTTTTTTVLPTTGTLVTEPSEPEASDPELVAWQSAAAEVCDEYEPRLEAITDELGPPEDLDEAAVVLDRTNPVNARYLRAIVALPVPESRRTQVEELHALATDLKEVARQAQAAAHFDDQDAYSLSMGGVATGSARFDELLLGLGVPECVPEADGGTA